jgi:hypothetical protein
VEPLKFWLVGSGAEDHYLALAILVPKGELPPIVWVEHIVKDDATTLVMLRLPMEHLCTAGRRYHIDGSRTVVHVKIVACLNPSGAPVGGRTDFTRSIHRFPGPTG